ncbi:MAG: sulfatase-like hydrolase/transferase, partial [Acidiferrobacterales bacterium]|nr:sulfatase-like hydrolase/transferase [Acidiferrobacterales bacterium]
TLVFSKGLVDNLASTEKADRFPNIIFFAADGIQASHLSLYGYGRETTPNLNAIAGESLVVHNAIANAGRTTGSTTSMLAGKYASTTKVIFPPHVLTDRHAFQHLPGILKKLGYKGIQETLRYYADAGDLNMVGGFDVANGRTLEVHTDLIPKNVLYKLYPTFVFLKKMKERLEERVLHLAGIKSMSSAFDQVNPDSPANVYGVTDQTRVDRVIEFIERHQQPVFAYIHLMDTHCCFPLPKTREFSKHHQKQTNHNFVDFYDDSILESDKHFGRLIATLKSAGEYENSLIVYSSDHTRGWRTNKSVPLLIKFPNGEFSGNRHGVNQLLDVAPTIVEYLGLMVPDWMEGMSYLNSEPDSNRHIFTVDSVSRERFRTNTDSLSRLVGSGPPLYGVEVATLVACGRNFYLNIVDGSFVRQKFNYQGEPCSKKLESDQAKQILEQHLLERDFVLPYLH